MGLGRRAAPRGVVHFLALRCGAVSGKNEAVGIGADLEVIRKRLACPLLLVLRCYCSIREPEPDNFISVCRSSA